MPTRAFRSLPFRPAPESASSRASLPANWPRRWTIASTFPPMVLTPLCRRVTP